MKQPLEKLKPYQEKAKEWGNSVQEKYLNEETAQQIKKKTSEATSTLKKIWQSIRTELLKYKFFQWHGWAIIGKFIVEELLAVTAGWSAGLLSIQFVHQHFEAKSWKNLWGFSRKNSEKVLVTKEEIEQIEEYTSYFAGLIMLLIVQFLIRYIVRRLKEQNQARKAAEIK